MKIRLNEDGSADVFKATFYEDEVLAIAYCLNFVLGMVKEQQKMGRKPFIDSGVLDVITDVANKSNQLVSQLPKESR